MSRNEMQRDMEAETAESIERLRFATDLAKAGLQSLTVVNGGALIALFTLIGAGKLPFSVAPLWYAFGCFVLGIASSLTAFLLGYLSQNQVYFVSSHRAMNLAARLAGREPDRDEATPHKLAMRQLNLAIISAALAILLFVIGSGLALAAFT